MQNVSYNYDMHRYINRRSTETLLDNLENYPVVALLGARQVGKSTLYEPK